MSQKQKKTFLLRIDNDLYNAISKLAEDDCRSINSEIEFILKKAISERSNLQKNKKEERADNKEMSESKKETTAIKSTESNKKTENKEIESQSTDIKDTTTVSNWMYSDEIPD